MSDTTEFLIHSPYFYEGEPNIVTGHVYTVRDLRESFLRKNRLVASLALRVEMPRWREMMTPKPGIISNQATVAIALTPTPAASARFCSVHCYPTSRMCPSYQPSPFPNVPQNTQPAQMNVSHPRLATSSQQQQQPQGSPGNQTQTHSLTESPPMASFLLPAAGTGYHTPNEPIRVVLRSPAAPTIFAEDAPTPLVAISTTPSPEKEREEEDCQLEEQDQATAAAVFAARCVPPPGFQPPCDHTANWKCRRVKLGIRHMICRECLVRWKQPPPPDYVPTTTHESHIEHECQA